MGAILIPKCNSTCDYSDLRGTFTSLDLLFSSACKLHITYNFYSTIRPEYIAMCAKILSQRSTEIFSDTFEN